MRGLTFCTILIVILLVAWLFTITSNNKRAREALQAAYTAYQDALKALKAKPTNADLKQHALALGREYSNLTRQNKGVTIFDEIALMNDINAATASAVAAPTQQPTTSAEDRLRQLTELKQKGLIDDSEFAAQRGKILEGI